MINSCEAPSSYNQLASDLAVVAILLLVIDIFLGSADSPAAVMNRKQRRRLQDAFRVPMALPVGIVDPVAAISLADANTVGCFSVPIQST